jgi:hypothetical protein
MIIKELKTYGRNTRRVSSKYKLFDKLPGLSLSKFTGFIQRPVGDVIGVFPKDTVLICIIEQFSISNNLSMRAKRASQHV